jgi:hypothetical protein
MPFIADVAFDSGLSYLDTNGTRLDICSQAPTSYSQATTAGTYSLGNATVNTGAPQDGVTDGRRVIVPAVTNGSVTNSGTASHWALTNGSNALLAWGTITTPQSVTAGNTWTLDAISITIRDAA